MVEIWGLETCHGCHGVNCCAMSWESRDVFWLGDFKGFALSPTIMTTKKADTPRIRAY